MHYALIIFVASTFIFIFSLHKTLHNKSFIIFEFDLKNMLRFVFLVCIPTISFMIKILLAHKCGLIE